MEFDTYALRFVQKRLRVSLPVMKRIVYRPSFAGICALLLRFRAIASVFISTQNVQL